MPSEKPCLGYASRTQAATALQKQGRSAHEISSMLGVSIKNVRSLLYERTRTARPNKERTVTSAAKPSTILDCLTFEERAILRAHAAKRDWSELRIAQAILEAAVEGDIVDAILDDGVGEARP